jgi:hypothetical protein
VSDQPEYLRPFLLDLPGPERERTGRVDLWLTRVGRERPGIAATVTEFLAAARAGCPPACPGR